MAAARDRPLSPAALVRRLAGCLGPLLLMAAAPAPAVTLTTANGLSIELDDRGRIGGLFVDDRPAPVLGTGGWEVIDLESGRDTPYLYPIRSAWTVSDVQATLPDDRLIDIAADAPPPPRWRLGRGWRLLDDSEPAPPSMRDAPAPVEPRPTTPPDAAELEATPADDVVPPLTVPATAAVPPQTARVARLELVDFDYSDALRFTLPAMPERAYTVRLWVRVPGETTAEPRLGVVPLSGLGRAVGEWIDFTPLRQPLPPGEWTALTTSVAAPPGTLMLLVYAALENGQGVLDVGGVEVVEHAPGLLEGIEGTVSGDDDQAVFQGTGGRLRVEARYRVVEEHLRVRAQVTAMGDGDRAVVVRFRLPLNGAGWRWWSDLGDSSLIAAESEELFHNWRHLAGGHLYSPYPFGCVTRDAPAAGLALASPLSQAVLTRYGFQQPYGLLVAFDLGFAPRLGKTVADLEFVISSPDARWGPRAVLDELYQLYPEDFSGTAPGFGAWFTALNPDAVPDPHRFGLLYDEQAPAHLEWTRANELVPLSHLMPWGQWSREGEADWADAGGLYPVRRVGAQTAPEEGLLHGPEGRPIVWPVSSDVFFTPWSTDPDLAPDGPAGLVNTLLVARLQGNDGEPLGGVFLDGIGNEWAGWQVDDYRDTHLAVSNLPLSHSRITRRPVRYTAIGHLEWLSQTSQRLRSRQQMILGSLDEAAPLPFVAPWLDVVGGGENLPTYEHLMWLRAIAYHKPVSYLEPTILDAASLPDERIEVWQEALMWGAYPGAAGWFSSRLVERNADTFDAFVPLLRRLTEARWEPIPHAVVSDAAVQMERFGQGPGLHLVLRNPTTQMRTITLTLDPVALGLSEIAPAPRTPALLDLLATDRRPFSLTPVVDRWQGGFDMPPHTVRILIPTSVAPPT